MASTWNPSKGLAAIVTAAAAAFGLCPSAAADPVTNPYGPPNPTQELPGLPALAQLSPIIQQAASNPGQATQLLMAAAQAFAHNPTTPTESKNVATSVNQFVADPTTQPAGVVPPDSGPSAPRATARCGAWHAGALADGYRSSPRCGPRARCGTGTHPARFGTGAGTRDRDRDCRGPRCGNGHSTGTRRRTGTCTRARSRPGGSPGFRP